MNSFAYRVLISSLIASTPAGSSFISLMSEIFRRPGFEVTCVEGEHFPPTRSGKGAHYELVHTATHSHKHSELGSGD